MTITIIDEGLFKQQIVLLISKSTIHQAQTCDTSDGFLDADNSVWLQTVDFWNGHHGGQLLQQSGYVAGGGHCCREACCTETQAISCSQGTEIENLKTN